MDSSVFASISSCLKTIKLATLPFVESKLTTAALATLLTTTVTTLVSFEFSANRVTAQTVYPFEALYDVEEVLTPIAGTDLYDALVLGYNPDAPYGLTNYTVKSYVQANLETGVVTFDIYPERFGLEGFPRGSVVYSSNNEDGVLFGSSSGVAKLDFSTGRIAGSSTEIIVGGTGKFSGATGKFDVFEDEPIPDDPTAPLKGQALVSGSFQTPESVPESESTTATTLVSIGLVGIAFLVRQRRI